MSETRNGEGERDGAAAYRVLARKYRPRSFDDLIGQEPMVRTLTNAFETGRIAQAWMLTGVRGVGKTTTARILARALNYETDEIHQPTIHMKGLGVHCQAIMEGRHVDVLEMDAASHTGIDDVREIIAQVRYRPVSARYKVYIIDEVHMLSNQAFNGLLKTLEEPPEHVKFVFATTEIRKVPITVLSRCQRFDLRRVDTPTLMAHLESIAQKEGVSIEEDALRLIARAAEGSVRDALSLTDQAIAHGAGGVDSTAVRDMLGLADRVRVIELFEMLMQGDASAALAEMREQYAAGADPAAVIADLADFTHLVTTLRYAPDGAEVAALSPMEAERGLSFSQSLSVHTLGQVWQLLLKALDEVRNASAPRQAAEMALIRVAHAADMPSPDDLLRLLRERGANSLPEPAADTRNGSGRPAGDAAGNGRGPDSFGRAPIGERGSDAAEPPSRMSASMTSDEKTGSAMRLQPAARPAIQTSSEPDRTPEIGSIEDLHALANEKRDSLMAVSIRRYLRPVRFSPGRVEVELTPEAPKTFVGDLTRRLHEWTGRRIVVTIANGGGGPTIDETKAAERASLLDDARNDPEVAAVLRAFPGARIVDVRLRADFAAEADVASMNDLDEFEPLPVEEDDDMDDMDDSAI